MPFRQVWTIREPSIKIFLVKSKSERSVKSVEIVAKTPSVAATDPPQAQTPSQVHFYVSMYHFIDDSIYMTNIFIS